MATVTNQSAPTTAAIALSTAIIGALGGFFLGQASSIGIFGGKPASKKHASTQDGSSDDEEPFNEPFSDDEQEGLDDFGSSAEEHKLTLVIRTDLGMTKGKMAAQASHATLACYKTLQRDPKGQKILQRWEQRGQAKVALQVKSEEELETLQAQAMSLGVCAKIIHDAGRTQIASGSATVLGVGPAPKSVVDQITGSLKLL